MSRLHEYLERVQNDTEYEVIDIGLQYIGVSGMQKEHMQCHEVIGWLKDNLKGKEYYKDLEFVQFKESAKLFKVMKEDEKKWRKLKGAEFLEEISEGHVNGHSFIKHKNKFIDPVLEFTKSMYRINTNDIQAIDKYLYDLYKRI